MPIYNVLVTREASEHANVRVEADSPEGAEEKALEVTRNEDLTWEVDEGNYHKPYIADPGNCAEEVTEDEEGPDALHADLAHLALVELVKTINFTGGLTKNDSGEYVPAVDEDWVDLGNAYLRACEALGIQPKCPEEDEAPAVEGDEFGDTPDAVRRARDAVEEAGTVAQPPPE